MQDNSMDDKDEVLQSKKYKILWTQSNRVLPIFPDRNYRPHNIDNTDFESWHVVFFSVIYPGRYRDREQQGQGHGSSLESFLLAEEATSSCPSEPRSERD